MLRKLGQNYQVAIPRDYVRDLRLAVHDYLDIRIDGTRIILEPQSVVPREQAYFYTADWQKDERAADADIKNGNVTKTKNLKELFKIMDRRRKTK